MLLSKKIIFAIAGTAAVILSVGSAFLLQGSSGSDEAKLESTTVELLLSESSESGDQNSGSSSTLTTPAAPAPQSSEKQTKSMSENIQAWKESRTQDVGKSGYLGSEGAVSNLENFDLSDAKSFSEAKSNDLSSFFGQQEDHKSTRSSLRVRTQKQKYPNGKGKGSLHWFGSFVHKNKGFITFNVAEFLQSQKSLKLMGGFYLLERDAESSKGKVKYYKEVEGDSKKITTQNFDKYFPKPYGGSYQGDFYKYYYTNGGFVSGSGELNNICGSSDCSGKTESMHYGGAWEGVGEQWYDRCSDSGKSKWCDRVYEGGSDSNDKAELQWYEYMYGKQELDLKKSLSSFIKGYWKMHPENMPKDNNRK